MTVPGDRVRYLSLGSGTYNAVIENVRDRDYVDLHVETGDMAGCSLSRIPRDDKGRLPGSWAPSK